MKAKLLEPIKGFEEVVELVVDLEAGDWYLTVMMSGQYAPCQAVMKRYGPHIRLTPKPKVKRIRIEFTEVDTFGEAARFVTVPDLAYYLGDDGDVQLGQDEPIKGKWLRKEVRIIEE